MIKLTPRATVTLVFIAFGFVGGANIGAIPVLVTQSGVSPFIFGIMAALGMVSNITALSLGGWINRHFDHRTVLLTILPLAYAAMIYTLTVHSVWSFALSFILFNFALGTLDLFMNAEGAVVEHDLAKPIFGTFHGAVMYAMGAFSILASLIATWYGPLWCALPPLPFVILALYAVHKTILPHVIEETLVDRKPVKLPKKILVLIGVALGLNVACELTCIQWAGQLLAELQPSLAAYSGLGAAFYCVCSGTMRVSGDTLRARLGDFRLVAGSLVVAISGFIMLSLTRDFAISVFAFAITGFGLAVVFPTLYSMAARLVPEARAAALSFVSGVGGLPRMVLPLILGALAQAYGLRTIYAAAAIVALAALALSMAAGREMARRGARPSPAPLTNSNP
jgi:MFS family permease